MDKFVIYGGIPLKGEVCISGAKNAAVAVLLGTILSDGVCRIENIPNISDVSTSIRVLYELGAEVRMINQTTIEINPAHIRSHIASYEMTKKMRASCYLMGALLGRFGKARVAPAG